MKNEKWFGIDSSTPLSLKNRLLCQLVEKFSAMTIEKDEHDENLYRFKSSEKTILVKISFRRWEEGTYDLIEVFGEDGKILISEEIVVSDYGGSTGQHHPFYELIELVRKKPEELTKIREINNILAAL